MNNRKTEWRRRRRGMARSVVEAAGFTGLCALVALSAVITKHATHHRALAPLAQLQTRPASPSQPPAALDTATDAEPASLLGMSIVDPMAQSPDSSENADAQLASDYPVDTRWFNGRPVRPARTMWMTVTAYSPDARSCGEWADGKTASLHSVWTNGMKLAAADTRILPIGSMITVPGYDNDQIVPVLDRGGAIKGHRLDMLYPTHEIAQQWGVKRLKITVWEYADGNPNSDWRKVRDSK